MTGGLRETVRQRAVGRCEYCRLPDVALTSEDFHVEHIIARKHGGKDDLENLAWACIYCNLYKGPNAASFDPDTGTLTPLFHSRRERWDDHFRVDDNARILGRTAVGRTTAWLLAMNSEILASLRTSLIKECRW